MLDETRLKAGMRVRYYTDVPGLSQDGTVSSWNETLVFVKYDDRVHKHGMIGTTAEGTYRRDLVEIDHAYNDRITTTVFEDGRPRAN